MTLEDRVLSAELLPDPVVRRIIRSRVAGVQGRFDRVVSVEMHEHVRNHKLLMQRLAQSLKAEGRLFGLVFCYRRHFYAFSSGRGAVADRPSPIGGMDGGRDAG